MKLLSSTENYSTFQLSTKAKVKVQPPLRYGGDACVLHVIIISTYVHVTYMCPPPPPHAQELDESKQEVERVQTELRAVRESYGKAQNTIRAARSRIQNITAEKEQVSNLYAVY